MKQRPSYNKIANSLLARRDLYYRLILSIGLLFAFPALGFLYFAVRYDILEDATMPVFLIAFLVFSFTGFIFLRSIFERVSKMSAEFSERLASDLPDAQFKSGTDELANIIDSFNTLETELRNSLNRLEARSLEISTLKELSDLCYMTFDTNELLFITLERALKLVKADVGSVLMLEQPSRKEFVVRAQIGLGDEAQVGKKIDFETSIAKYAVINKSPLLVENIEKDNRFGRINRPVYASKSFICMPLKTIGDIIGVINISRKNDTAIFTHDDIEVLAPLLSNAAFTFENIRLSRENEGYAETNAAMKKILKTINSSLNETELVTSILHDIQSLLTCDLALVLLKDDNRPDELVIYDFVSKKNVNISKGIYYACKDSIFDKVIKQEMETYYVTTAQSMNTCIERELFGEQQLENCMLCTLKISGKITGVLVLCVTDLDLFRKKVNTDFLAILRESVALAVERIKLSSSAIKRDQELDTLKQIGGALASSTFDIDRVLKYAMDMIRLTMGVEAGSLLLLDHDELEFKASFYMEPTMLNRPKIKLGQGIAGYVASRGRSLVINDVRQSPHFFSVMDELTGFKTRSALCVPMISQGKSLE